MLDGADLEEFSHMNGLFIAFCFCDKVILFDDGFMRPSAGGDEGIGLSAYSVTRFRIMLPFLAVKELMYECPGNH